MRRPLVNPEHCHNCQAFLREEAGDKPWIDFYRCRGCMHGKTACANGAIEELVQPGTGGRRMSW